MVARKSVYGFSMVELLVALAIGLLILAGVIQAFSSSKRNFIDQEELAFIQENARFAIDTLSRDIRMAGYMGCASPDSAKVANSIDDDVSGFVSLGGIEGFEGSTSVVGFPVTIDSPTVGSDAVIVRHADATNPVSIQGHNPTSANIQIYDNHVYPQGTTMMMVDASCRQVGLFQLSGPNSTPANTINHNRNVGAGNPAQNCSHRLGGSFDCTGCPASGACPNSVEYEYGPGSSVMQFLATAYFISDSNIVPGMPALKREILNVSGSVVGTKEEELVAGVEHLELLYGIDATDDGEVDRYVQADQMDLNGDLVIDEDDWEFVRTVRISITLRSQTPMLESAQSITLNGVAYNDRFLRQAITTTVQLRNRG